MAEYPLPKFHFRVEWGGTTIGFSEVSGLEVSTDKIEYRDGSSPEYTKIRMPGMQTYGDLTLKRGMFASNNEFYEWWNSVKLNKIERRDIVIKLLNEEHAPVVTWTIKNAWPTKVTSTNLNSTENAAAIETLVLTHEGLTMTMA